MAQRLTDRQQEVFDFIRETARNEHRPPTVREIAEHFGFRSPKAVTDHLGALQRKGYITRTPRKSRNIEIRSEFAPRGIPVVGRIAAGSPILAVENLEGALSFETLFEPTANVLAVRVHGDSMREAGILDGDYVVVESGAPVKNGAIGVVRIGDEATVKRVFFEDGTVRLKAENPDFQDITLGARDPQVEIYGPVRGVVRRV